jgi:hypothetical protein
VLYEFLYSSYEELVSATISRSKTNSRVCEIVLDLEVLLLDVADDTQPSFVILSSALANVKHHMPSSTSMNKLPSPSSRSTTSAKRNISDVGPGGGASSPADAVS